MLETEKTVQPFGPLVFARKRERERGGGPLDRPLLLLLL